MTDSPQPQERRSRSAAAVLVAVLAIVLVVTGGVALVTGGAPRPSASPAPTPTAGPDGFPVEVLGMPVVTVADALALIDSGALHGRAVAVGGWWLFSIDFPCPLSPGDVPPLLGDCHEYQGFASQGYEYYTCDAQGNPNGCGTGERPPGVAEMELRFMPETVGADVAHMAAYRSSGGMGVPAVVIGHSGDPRQLQCLGDARASCERQFVVDRVVWLAGNPIDQIAPTANVAHGMVAEEAVAATRKEGAPISAVAVRRGDAPKVDPRFPGVGAVPVWVVRTLRSGETVAGEDSTRGVDVTLVDDATAEILATFGLEMADSYQPATLLIQATETGAPADDELYPYYRVETADGVGVQEMRIGDGSWSSGDPVQRYQAGLPAVVEPGDYVIRAWRAQAGRDAPIGPARDECTTSISAAALAVMRLQAAFPATGACAFVTPTFETVFDQ